MLKRFHRTLRHAALTLLCLPAVVHAADVPAALAAYKNRVVYVDFWASWCAPCAESFGWLNTLQQKFGPRLVVVGVNVDEDQAAAAAFLKRHPAQFDIVRDADGAIAAQYEIPGMPTSLILDGRGQVLHQHVGFRRSEIGDYENAIADALERAASKP